MEASTALIYGSRAVLYTGTKDELLSEIVARFCCGTLPLVEAACNYSFSRRWHVDSLGRTGEVPVIALIGMGRRGDEKERLF